MTVYLVGAGPGDPELLTVRAARLLAGAEVVVHDRLVSRDVLALAGGRATLIDAGKTPGGGDAQGAINDLLVGLGRRHDRVVRLKGGDPFVFGRGAEEVLALVDAGLEVEVVPGISSALAAPLLAGIAVTHRGVAHGVSVVTATGRGEGEVDLAAAAVPGITLVVLMGVARRARVAAQLLGAGFAPDTPVAVVERASLASQRTTRWRLDQLAGADVSSPAVLVIGEAAATDLTRRTGSVAARAGAGEAS